MFSKSVDTLTVLNFYSIIYSGNKNHKQHVKKLPA